MTKEFKLTRLSDIPFRTGDDVLKWDKKNNVLEILETSQHKNGYPLPLDRINSKEDLLY